MKKRLLTLICVLFSIIAFTQSVPQGINYQSIARDSTGSVLVAEALTIQFSASSSAVQFGTVVCGNSDNNSLLIHLNIK